MGSLVDLRFLLPLPVERVQVLNGLAHAIPSFAAAGMEVVAAGADTVVASSSDAARVAELGPAQALLLGTGGERPLRRAGYRTLRYLPVPAADRPVLAIPAGRPALARYGLTRLSIASSRLLGARNATAAAALGRRLPLPGTILVASRDGAPVPHVVRAAETLGVGADADWIASLTRHVERPAFLVFPAGASIPSWVVKYSRDPNDGQFDLDELGHAVVAAAGESVAERAPRYVGRARAGRLPFSVESAAPGGPLVGVLRSPLPGWRKLAAVDAVAAWLVDVAAGTQGEPLPPGAARRAIVEAAEVDLSPLEGLPFFAPGTVDELLGRIARVPRVVMHGDLDVEHVLVADDDFTVIDWAGGTTTGLPLLDLAFFLGRALPIADGELDDPSLTPGEAFGRLFRGEAPSSPRLFDWLTRAAEISSLGDEQVAALVSLTWLRFATAGRVHHAETWFSDPRLGPDWPAWQRVPAR